MNSVADILNGDALLEAAQAETGLSDFGDESLPRRFTEAVGRLRDLGLDPSAQSAAASVCHWLLTTRLEFFEDRKRYPIGNEKIVKPLFATGEPRAGTTLLHALLSVDPNGRALRFWEVMYPSPPPGVAKADDPRRARADADWKDILKRLPKWLISHPYNDMLGDGLPECERTWAFDFRIMSPTAWWRVRMPPITDLPADPSAQYRLHKMMLQQCQFARPKKYWVLKGFHSARLKALFETYPDARIIWVHRDPVQAIASRIALLCELNEGLVGHVDRKEQAAIQLAIGRANFADTLRNPYLDDPRIHHVRYPDFVRDPVTSIRLFYERYDTPFTSETESALRDYLQNNKSDRYGKFHYSTDMIDTDINALHDELAPYRERFGLDIEQR